MTKMSKKDNITYVTLASDDRVVFDECQWHETASPLNNAKPYRQLILFWHFPTGDFKLNIFLVFSCPVC